MDSTPFKDNLEDSMAEFGVGLKNSNKVLSLAYNEEDAIRQATEWHISGHEEAIPIKIGKTGEIRRKVSIGDLVMPVDKRNPFVCGSGRYEFAVVVSVEPFVMVSEETDMRWSCYPIENVMPFGRASDETLKNCMRRIEDSE